MGEIYYVDLGEHSDSRQGGLRPVVIMQEGRVLKNTQLVWVMPLTSKLKALHLPVHKIIHKSSETGLTSDSMTLIESMDYIPKNQLRQKIGKLPTSYYPEIKDALAAQFPMFKYGESKSNQNIHIAS